MKFLLGGGGKLDSCACVVGLGFPFLYDYAVVAY
jgi:hypothetical protein